MMKNTIQILSALVLLSCCTLYSTGAAAQTSMQRRAQEQNPQQESSVEQTRSTQTAEQPRADEPRDEAQLVREERPTDSIFHFYRVHMPGLRLDFGSPWGTPYGNTIFGVGLGYMYAMGWEIIPIEKAQANIRLGVGPDLTLGVSNQGVHGVSGFIAARAGVLSTAAGGLEVEGALGAGIGQGLLSPAFRIGIFLSGEYLALGYFYQQVLRPNRPDWMRPHFIGLRFHLPVLKQ